MTTADEHSGPLRGLRVLELTGIGPGPCCAMLLADMGAEVVRLDRPGGNGWPNTTVDRGRYVIEVDLHEAEGRDLCRLAAEKADVLIEGFRPGVMERLGLGPDTLLARNPRLIYGRMTGWGQTGPLAKSAGHDINYIALTGALAALGRPGGPPSPPLNLVGDLGGGALFLAFGILAALWERERSGSGQVIDAAIVDGVASMMGMFTGMITDPRGSLDRDRSLLGGAAPFYGCYTCADARDLCVGALEPKFYRELIERVGAPAGLLEGQYETAHWPSRREALERLFATKSRDEWCELLEGSDACVAPVLTAAESFSHPHFVQRGTYAERHGLTQPSPAPRLSRTPGAIAAGGDGKDALRRWGVKA
ncbi:MAG: CoA transferase [Proteobacteria bacterium]|nr:CoA transferase [Pseudomonadota bacterium]